MALKCKDGNIQKRSEEHPGQTGNKNKEDRRMGLFLSQCCAAAWEGGREGGLLLAVDVTVFE